MALRVALIGYGTGGAIFHAPLIRAVPDLTLAAIVTGDPQRQQAARTRHPDARIIPTPQRLWDDADAYDIAVITTPNRHHAPLARAALDAGLHVVIDKPVAVTAAQARDIADLAARRGLAAIPYHNRRWDGDFRTLRRLIADGALGHVQRLESRFERWRPTVKPGWKESADPADAGGILYDLGTHLIDQAIVLFGRPTRVYAELDVRRPDALAHDDAFVALHHPGGTRTHLWMSATAADLGPRFRALGDRASYVVHGMDGQEEALRAGRTPLDEDWGTTPPSRHGRLGTPGRTRAVPTAQGAYQDFYAATARAVRGEAAPPVTMADAVAGLEVIEAALRSAECARVVGL
ncbi:Gfo/Idh/MocA family oxidoreductase [Thermomonospora catenispora]|uniref:Gfo/Idh/MocA family oxidoreductase n=1 Tax=Thermomonospora catenispora TaxID=2493090 RepID=UPI0011220A65|nr:Gfo/Idh/MocA family oxidoreductase [Thermomonospora catenispora]TNY36318.1 oxidoreductase [Thermomonospora catenispora]